MVETKRAQILGLHLSVGHKYDSQTNPNDSFCCSVSTGCVNKQLLANVTERYKVEISWCCVYTLLHCPQVAKKETNVGLQTHALDTQVFESV